MVEIKDKSGKVIFTYDDANLSGADLRCADLFSANLSGVNLSGADLSGADLFNADLSNANLSGANLRGTNLRCVILSGANLSDADLFGANLNGADLSGAYTEFGVLRDIMQVSNIGSRKDTIVVYHTEQGIFVKCGCFKDSLSYFETKVRKTHKGNHHEQTYLAMIEFVKVRFQNK